MRRLPALALAASLLLALSGGPALPQQDGAEQQRVDQAVNRGLEFLAATQAPNGSWRANNYGESTAVTSLSVMAFLAAGHLPGEGPYGNHILAGIDYVLDQQHANGMLVSGTSHGPMYCHGISTLMLAEVIGMLDERRELHVREALEAAVTLILEAQDVPRGPRDAGGWRYQPSSNDSDISVTGWQLLALRAARNAGCDVPVDNIERAVAYLKRCAVPGGGFTYQPGQNATAPRTGTGILGLEICGRHNSPEAIDGGDWLLAHPLNQNEPFFFYGVYYCAQGMFQLGDDYWMPTREHLHRLLLPGQRPDGSWQPIGNEQQVGSQYATAMAILALAVEYQYLPIYQR